MSHAAPVDLYNIPVDRQRTTDVGSTHDQPLETLVQSWTNSSVFVCNQGRDCPNYNVIYVVLAPRLPHRPMLVNLARCDGEWPRQGHCPVNTKHLYNICTMLDQRRRRWADFVQMLYKCFVFAGCWLPSFWILRKLSCSASVERLRLPNEQRGQ